MSQQLRSKFNSKCKQSTKNDNVQRRLMFRKRDEIYEESNRSSTTLVGLRVFFLSSRSPDLCFHGNARCRGKVVNVQLVTCTRKEDRNCANSSSKKIVDIVFLEGCGRQSFTFLLINDSRTVAKRMRNS